MGAKARFASLHLRGPLRAALPRYCRRPRYLAASSCGSEVSGKLKKIFFLPMWFWESLSLRLDGGFSFFE